MQYLTYEEYKKLCGTLEETAFNRNIHRATGIISNATHGRIEQMQAVPDQAKALCRDLIEYISENHSNSKALTSKSQSAGNVSENESYSVKTIEETEKDIQKIIYDYLLSVSDDNGTPLLYRGCLV